MKIMLCKYKNNTLKVMKSLVDIDGRFCIIPSEKLFCLYFGLIGRIADDVYLCLSPAGKNNNQSIAAGDPINPGSFSGNH